MKKTVLLTLSLVAILTGCEDKKPAPTSSGNSSGNPLTAPVDYLGAVAQAKKHADKSLDLVSVKKAVQEFYAGEGRFPKDLQEMVTEKYLTFVPKPPHGLKITYNPQNGEVKIVQDTAATPVAK
jgi:hypothetical protein